MNCRPLLYLILGLLCLTPFSKAISERNYEHQYQQQIVPFLQSGQQLCFPSADEKYKLRGIRFIHSKAVKSKGLIVVVNGFGQTWMQYGELFYDLYHQGYDVISYDHRGQGTSPHLVANNSQIEFIGHFSDYSTDLNSFMQKVVKPLRPQSQGLFLIANSMGGAIAADYLERHSSPPPFQAIVLSAPMFRINTAPYPEWLGHLIVGTMDTIGLGKHYAIGMHDFYPATPFSENKITHSFPRWWADRKVKIDDPEVVIGGPSNRWVDTSLSATKNIRSNVSSIKVPTLLLKAGKDQLVRNQAIAEAAKSIPDCKLDSFPESRHGILMESDSIRNRALREIERFFEQR